MSGESTQRVPLMERAEYIIYLATAITLMIAAAGLLIFAVVEMVRQALAGDYVAALLKLLDRKKRGRSPLWLGA